MSHVDQSITDATIESLQTLSVAGADNAFTRIYGEERAMSGALNILLFVIQKLVGLPLQAYASVRAAVYVSAYLIALADDKDGTGLGLKGFSSGVFKFVELAKLMFQVASHSRLIQRLMCDYRLARGVGGV